MKIKFGKKSVALAIAVAALAAAFTGTTRSAAADGNVIEVTGKFAYHGLPNAAQNVERNAGKRVNPKDPNDTRVYTSLPNVEGTDSYIIEPGGLLVGTEECDRDEFIRDGYKGPLTTWCLAPHRIPMNHETESISCPVGRWLVVQLPNAWWTVRGTDQMGDVYAAPGRVWMLVFKCRSDSNRTLDFTGLNAGNGVYMIYPNAAGISTNHFLQLVDIDHNGGGNCSVGCPELEVLHIALGPGGLHQMTHVANGGWQVNACNYCGWRSPVRAPVAFRPQADGPRLPAFAWTKRDEFALAA